MKKIFSLGLVSLMVLFLLVGCSTKGIEGADAYIQKLDSSYHNECSWKSEVRRSSGLQIYLVTVSVPFYDSSEFQYSGIEQRALWMMIEDVYPVLNEKLEQEDDIDTIMVMFKYENGYTSRFVYSNGSWTDLSAVNRY